MERTNQEKDLCETCFHCVHIIIRRKYDHKYLFAAKRCCNRPKPFTWKLFTEPVTSCDFYFKSPHFEPLTAEDIETLKVLRPLLDKHFLWSKTYILQQTNFKYNEQPDIARKELKKEVKCLAEEIPEEISVEEFMTLEEKAPVKGKTTEDEVLALITDRALPTSTIAKKVNPPNGITYSAMWSRLTRLLKAGKVSRKYKEGKAYWMAKSKITSETAPEATVEEVPEVSEEVETV